MTGDLVDLPALGPDGEYRTRNREIIEDTAGVPVAETSVVPRLFVQRSIDAQRKLLPLAAADREAALTRAADVFASSTIAGLDFDSYVELTCRVTGLPMTTARAGAHAVAESLTTACDAVRPARPVGASSDWRDLSMSGGGAVWARRGEVLAVHAPGNAPGVHGLWPQALALGYRVAIRPSRREPFTAHRLTHALRQNGFRAGDVLYLPTDHAVVDKYAGNPRVLTNGPGRTKILITAECDWRDYLDVIVDSIANLGGMACVNATAVLYEGAPRRWHMPSQSGCRRSRRCRTPTNGPFCQRLPSRRRRLSPITSRPGPPGRSRFWAPARWSPTSAVGSPPCARPCTCWPHPTRPSSTSNCPSPVRGSRRGHVGTVSRRCETRSCST